MNSLDDMKKMISVVNGLEQPAQSAVLTESTVSDTDHSGLAQLIADYVIDNELELDFDDLESVADELNTVLHYDRQDLDPESALLTADDVQRVLPDVHGTITTELDLTDPETAAEHAERLHSVAAQLEQYPGVTEDMLIPREYQFAEDELDEADLNNGYGQHHSVDGEDLFPDGADGPIQRKVPGRSDNRLGRDKAVPVESLGEGRDFADFQPIEPTETVVKKFTYRGVSVIITHDSDPEFEDAAYQMYFDNDHYGEYPNIEEAVADARYEIRNNPQHYHDDGSDPDQMGLFTESTKSSAPTESLEESFQRLQKIYDNYTKRSARK